MIVQGLDRPVVWARAGLLDLALFVPYSYVVLPSTITSFVVPGEI